MARCAIDGELIFRTNPLAGQIGPDRDVCQRHHVNGRKDALPINDLQPCRDERCARCRTLKRARAFR